ncbi:hypothetical protein [Pseudarthrobacter sp. H2]|uniref:hypothetical protein n=1 Tax=Pseudarthrobacter sp. H2 TaxID=3418415 RepID=UPI003CE970A4
MPSDVVKLFQPDADVPAVGVPGAGVAGVGAVLGLLVGDADGGAVDPLDPLDPQPASNAAAQTHADTAQPATRNRPTLSRRIPN